MRLATAAEMRELDRATIEDLGLPGRVLMESAGAGVVRAIEARLPSLAGVPIGVVCGAGNNGGDGYVVARQLWDRGADVRIYPLTPRERLAGDARANRELAERLGIPQSQSLDGLGGERVLVDAVLGTGLSAEVRGPAAEAIDRINAAPAGVLRVAVDIPSGLDSDTGKVHGRAVRAQLTVTMGVPKVGLLTWPGCEFVGELVVVDIGIPRTLVEASQLATFFLDAAELFGRLRPRPEGGHKGTFGHALVVAGSVGKAGAALLCGEAALRGGAGLVTLAVPAVLQPATEGRVRELMTAGYADVAAVTALAQGKRAVALGPGVPTDPGSRALAVRLALELLPPTVVDADALNALAAAGAVGELSRAAGARILTPHPGEMARLVGQTVEAVQADRVGVARQLAAASRAVVVLKGARTVIAAPDGRAFINSTGNSALGTAGTGDVLTGLVAGLLAQGLTPLDAALVGVWAHGAAGDRARAALAAERGLLAGELLLHLPAALASAVGN
jgi:NAD(P)H-hydrate epimerase